MKAPVSVRKQLLVSALALMLILSLVSMPNAAAQSGSAPQQPDMPASGIAPTATLPQGPLQEGPEQLLATISVDDDYTGSTPGWGVTAFATIQGGINGAASGDTVLVYPGSYVESPTVDKPLTLQSFAGNRYYPGDIALSTTQAPGYWYPDRYPPYGFGDDSSTFPGNDVIRHSINVADSAGNRPPAYSSTFYNTQGRKYDTSLTGSVQSMSIDLWVDSNWIGQDRNAGLWATGFDNSSPTPQISAYPIIAFRNTAVTPGFYKWDYINGGYTLAKAATASDYDQWHTLSFVLTVGTGIEYFVDGVSVGLFADADTVSLKNVILNAYNFGATYDVYWDNFLVGSDSFAAFESAITGKLTIDSSDVTVDGFYMTNPGQTNAVLVANSTPSHSIILLKHNYVTNVGSPSLTSNVHAVLVNRGADNVTISQNRLDNLTSNTRSVSAIGVLDTASTDPSSNLLIADNVIADVDSNWGAYGIIINNGAGAPDAQILNNSISDIEGLWAHGIGLEGPTPNALVQGNRLDTLIDHKTPTDAAAIMVEANPAAGSVNIDQNCFTNINIGVQNVTGITVDAEENWWGHGSGPSNPANPGGTGAVASANVDFSPWVTEGCGGATTVLSASTNDALICTSESTTININLADVVGLYGYQIEVNYNPSLVTATGAFVNTLFTTAPPASIAAGWEATCAAGVCRFGVAHVAPQTAVTGSGVLAQITLTGVAPGAFNVTVGTNTLTDIDGVPIYQNAFVPLPITVCGYATISGFVTLQGRPGNNVDIGTVTMTEQAPASFSSVAPVNFSATTGAYSISVPYLPGGSSYKILAEHGLYLDNEDTITVIGNLANKNTRLWGGDTNNDGKVSIPDLSCIGGSFGASPPFAACGTGSPDINADNLVNVQDLAIAGGNFDKCSPQPWNWSVAPPVYTCP